MQEEKFWERIAWFQFLFAIFVIWDHAENVNLFASAAGPGAGLLTFETEVVWYLGRLGVAGFYLCSGYLFYRGFTIDKLLRKWKSRVFTLLIPYIVWNFIYYLLHYFVRKVPGLASFFADQTIELSWKNVWNAVVNYQYNPVFWYLQFLIVFVVLCPVIYAFLKNRYVGIMALCCLAVVQSGIIFKVQNPFLGAAGNWLLIYGVGAYAGLHLKKWVEEVHSGKIILATGAVTVVFAVICTRYTNVVFSLLYFGAAPVFFWLIIQKLELPKPAMWMRNTFMVYASHHMVVRLVTKLFALWWQSPVCGALLFLMAPVYSFFLAEIFRRICSGRLKFIWRLLTGGR